MGSSASDFETMDNAAAILGAVAGIVGGIGAAIGLASFIGASGLS